VTPPPPTEKPAAGSSAGVPRRDERKLSLGIIVIIFLVALVARAGWGTVRHMRMPQDQSLEFPDEEQYWEMAAALRAGKGLPDELGFQATRMPLYPGFLAIFVRLDEGMFKAKVVQWVLGAIGAVLVAGLATAMFDRRVGLLAGLFVACDPFFVFFSSLLLTETLFLTILAGLWWVAWRALSEEATWRALPRWLLMGILSALCVYARESSLGLIVLVCLFAVIQKRFALPTMVGAGCIAAIIVVALLPWAARNHRVIGQWCWLTTRAGISLYDGVGPRATGASDLGDIKAAPQVAGLTEVQWNRHFLDLSFAAIRAEPARVFKLAWKKLGRMWSPVPNVETYRSAKIRLLAAGWTLPTFAFAVAGVILLIRRHGREGLREVIFLLLPAIYLSLVHSVFVGSVRYRLGAMPNLEILAAVALIAALVRLDVLKHKG
jgi:4-amino-4-deoxy-L-arabinose transferase-like glycosyltransferase